MEMSEITVQDLERLRLLGVDEKSLTVEHWEQLRTLAEQRKAEAAVGHAERRVEFRRDSPPEHPPPSSTSTASGPPWEEGMVNTVTECYEAYHTLIDMGGRPSAPINTYPGLWFPSTPHTDALHHVDEKCYAAGDLGAEDVKRWKLFCRNQAADRDRKRNLDSLYRFESHWHSERRRAKEELNRWKGFRTYQKEKRKSPVVFNRYMDVIRAYKEKEGIQGTMVLLSQSVKQTKWDEWMEYYIYEHRIRSQLQRQLKETRGRRNEKQNAGHEEMEWSEVGSELSRKSEACDKLLEWIKEQFNAEWTISGQDSEAVEHCYDQDESSRIECSSRKKTPKFRRVQGRGKRSFQNLVLGPVQSSKVSKTSRRKQLAVDHGNTTQRGEVQPSSKVVSQHKSSSRPVPHIGPFNASRVSKPSRNRKRPGQSPRQLREIDSSLKTSLTAHTVRSHHVRKRQPDALAPVLRRSERLRKIREKEKQSAISFIAAPVFRYDMSEQQHSLMLAMTLTIFPLFICNKGDTLPAPYKPHKPLDLLLHSLPFHKLSLVPGARGGMVPPSIPNFLHKEAVDIELYNDGSLIWNQVHPESLTAMTTQKVSKILREQAPRLTARHRRRWLLDRVNTPTARSAAPDRPNGSKAPKHDDLVSQTANMLVHMKPMVDRNGSRLGLRRPRDDFSA
ncbi:MAG: hypothetical protein M1816_005927 [Peltula sp. TS41687]|nr:MAG: hypothetical protein M1816_005927 [Peltula sp. TS41687]